MAALLNGTLRPSTPFVPSDFDPFDRPAPDPVIDEASARRKFDSLERVCLANGVPIVKG